MNLHSMVGEKSFEVSLVVEVEQRMKRVFAGGSWVRWSTASLVLVLPVISGAQRSARLILNKMCCYPKKDYQLMSYKHIQSSFTVMREHIWHRVICNRFRKENSQLF